MLRKTLLFIGALGLFSTVWAGNVVTIKHAEKASKATTQNAIYGCYVDVENLSWDDIYVTAFYDDGEVKGPFNIAPYAPVYRFPLDYYGYCHSSLFIKIQGANGRLIYSADTPVGQKLTIYNSNKNEPKAKLSPVK